MLFIDTETYNDQKDIRKAGTYEYTRTCEVLLVSYAFHDGKPVLWDRTKDPEKPNDLRVSLTGGKQTLIAPNAMFARNVNTHGLGIDAQSLKISLPLQPEAAPFGPGGHHNGLGLNFLAIYGAAPWRGRWRMAFLGPSICWDRSLGSMLTKPKSKTAKS